MKQIPAVILVIDGLQSFVNTYDEMLKEDSPFYQTLTKIGNLALSNDIF